MNYFVGFLILSGISGGLLVAAVGYYLHRKGIDKAVMDAAKQDIQDKLK